jgi:hypothetical protein
VLVSVVLALTVSNALAYFAGKKYVLWHNTSGLYDKPMMIVNDDSWVVNKLEASLADNTRVVIYDRNIFM